MKVTKMQFDDNELENNNNNGLPEENSNSISWEDLLNPEQDAGVSNDADTADEKKQEISAPNPNTPDKEDSLDIDLDLFTDEALGIHSPLLEHENPSSNDLSDLDIASKKAAMLNLRQDEEGRKTPASIFDDLARDDENDNGTNDAFSTNNEKPAKFNLNEAANEYVNSIDVEETGTVPYEQPIQDIADNNSADDILNTSITAGELLQGAGQAAAQKTAKQNTAQNTGFNSNETPAGQDENVDFYPNVDKKKPVLLFVALGLIGVLVLIFLALTFVFAPKVDKDVALAPGSGYSVKGGDAQLKKQTDELIDKVENSNIISIDDLDTKREIISVKFAGRSNPFVPASIIEDGIFGAELNSPPDILVDSPAAMEARKLLSISVSGIMYDPSKPSAIVRFGGKDYFVQKDDRIDTYSVRLITKDYVVLGNGANTYRAYVGESFKADEKVPESKQMRYNDGYRQYISSDDIQISTK